MQNSTEDALRCHEIFCKCAFVIEVIQTGYPRCIRRLGLGTSSDADAQRSFANMRRWAMDVGDKNRTGKLSKHQLRAVLVKYRSYIRRQGDLVGVPCSYAPKNVPHASTQPQKHHRARLQTRTHARVCVLVDLRTLVSTTCIMRFILQAAVFFTQGTKHNLAPCSLSPATLQGAARAGWAVHGDGRGAYAAEILVFIGARSVTSALVSAFTRE